MTTQNSNGLTNRLFKPGEVIPEITLIDETGKAASLRAFWKERPTLFVFLRHFG